MIIIILLPGHTISKNDGSHSLGSSSTFKELDIIAIIQFIAFTNFFLTLNDHINTTRLPSTAIIFFTQC